MQYVIIQCYYSFHSCNCYTGSLLRRTFHFTVTMPHCYTDHVSMVSHLYRHCNQCIHTLQVHCHTLTSLRALLRCHIDTYSTMLHITITFNSTTALCKYRFQYILLFTLSMYLATVTYDSNTDLVRMSTDGLRQVARYLAVTQQCYFSRDYMHHQLSSFYPTIKGRSNLLKRSQVLCATYSFICHLQIHTYGHTPPTACSLDKFAHDRR